MKLNNVKMLVQPHQTREIQRIIWSQGGYWDNKIKTSDYLHIQKGRMSWCSKSFNADLVDADTWIREYNKEWFSKRTILNLEKYVLSGAPVSVSKIEEEYIRYLKVNEYEITYEGQTGYTMTKRINLNTVPTNLGTPDILEDYIQDTAEIKPGTIVLATRKSNSDKVKDYTWQGTYFGYCNGKHLIDANETHVQLADEIVHIPTLTKKEAKQKISELFANANNSKLTSESIRNIIDLIKD